MTPAASPSSAELGEALSYPAGQHKGFLLQARQVSVVLSPKGRGPGRGVIRSLQGSGEQKDERERKRGGGDVVFKGQVPFPNQIK